MGRRGLLRSFLARELLLYAPPEQPPQPGIVSQPLLLTRCALNSTCIYDKQPHACKNIHTQSHTHTHAHTLTHRRMPTRQQLLDAGRQDLVQLVQQVGGFTEVRRLLATCCC